MRTRTLTALLTLAIATSPVSAEEPIPQDSAGITLMVLRADKAGLKALGSKGTSSGHLAARAAYYRVNWEPEKSDEWAQACIRQAESKKKPSPGALYMCKSLLAGNALARGDIDQWARTMLEVKPLYLSDVIHPADTPSGHITRPDFARFVGRPRSGELADSIRAPVTLPIRIMTGLPVIQARLRDGLDGKKRDVTVDFVLDTGASRSILTPEAAAAIGLKVTEGFVTTAYNDRQADYGLTDPLNVDLGGVVLKNVQFMTSNTIKINLIGIDLMTQLGAMRIDHEYLQLLGSRRDPNCTQKLHVGSLLWGVPWMPRIPIQMGKHQPLALLDTGFPGALQSSGLVPSGLPPESFKHKQIVDMFGVQDVSYVEDTAHAQIGALKLSLPLAITNLPAQVYPVSWKLGFEALHTHPLYLDAANGYACLQ